MKEANKVVLYFPRVFSDTRPWHGTPLAPLALSGFLLKEGIEVKIIADFLYRDHVAELLRQCRESICLGLSCMTGFQIYDALRVAEIARKTYPELPIVWGGWHPSVTPEETIRDERVDILVRGQGERKFTEVVRRLKDGTSLEGIAGVTYKSKDGSPVSNPDSHLEDMNNFPPYPYHLIDIEKCLGATEYGRRTIHYTSSYGCPHCCGFCIEPVVNRRRWTALAPERVVDDWERLQKRYRVDSVAVYDSNFFVDKNRVYRICLDLMKRKININWGNVDGNIAQLVEFEPEIWEAMERSGCRMILTGAESGSPDALKLMNKKLNGEQARRFTELCHKHHIRVFFSYVMGLPWSKTDKKNTEHFREEFKLTLDQIGELMVIDPVNRFSISVYTPYPGSYLYQRALEFGFQPPNGLAGWSNFTAVAEDAFNIDRRRRWLTKSQTIKVSMLTQYIFGLMDLPARNYIADRMSNPVTRCFFLLAWNVGLWLARLRWRHRFLALPLDFWFFTQVRKYLKLN